MGAVRAVFWHERVLRLLRRGLLAVLLGSLVYAWRRFDLLLLPAGARSPLHGVHAGDRLLVDRSGSWPRPDEIVLFRGPAGELLLARCAEPPAGLDERARAELLRGGRWLLFDREFSDLQDSRDLGPIPAQAVLGRVILVLPW